LYKQKPGKPRKKHQLTGPSVTSNVIGKGVVRGLSTKGKKSVLGSGATITKSKLRMNRTEKEKEDGRSSKN